MIIINYFDVSYISQPEVQSRAGVYISPRTNIQQTNTTNFLGKKASACIINNNEKCHGISHVSRTGRIIWKLPERDIHANCPSRNGTLTTANTGGNRKYWGKQYCRCNSKTKKIQINKHKILLGQRYNNRGSFTHIIGWGKEKPDELFHEKPSNMAPQSYETKVFKTNKNDMENSKDRITVTGRGCAGTTNLSVTRKLDNPLKEIRNVVRNKIRRQWPRGLTVPS